MTWTRTFASTPGTAGFDVPLRDNGWTVQDAERADGGPGVRLTRRGRLLVVLLLAGLLLAAFSLGRAGSSQAASTVSPATPVVSTTVHVGETLWAVAQRVSPGSDPREVVALLRRLNHLGSVSLQVGQQLVVPA